MKTIVLLSALIIGNCVFAQDENLGNDSVVIFFQCPAEFPGGYVQLSRFVITNFEYDCLDAKAFEYSKLYIIFIVEKDGSISNQDILNYKRESVLIKNKIPFPDMPQWRPACDEDGLPVRERVRVPMTFDP